MTARVEPADVLDFWFGAPGSEDADAERKAWFAKDDAFDRMIAERFGPTIEQGLRGELDAWQADAEASLARVLVLDQFTRNAFRDTPRAFAGDAQALAGASAAVGARFDDDLPPIRRSFLYMPFQHSESRAMQDESVRLFSKLANEQPSLAHRLDYAFKHREVIERFGRFPHRNAILGRQSTAEEAQFLKQPGSRF